MSILLPNPIGNSIDMGQLCAGQTYDLVLCNTDIGAQLIYSFNSCGCPGLTFSTPSGVIDACSCETITVTLTGLGYPNLGNCFITITIDAVSTVIQLSWEEVYCPLVASSWELSDSNQLIQITNTNFDANCDTFTQGAMGEAKYIKRTFTLTQPLVAGDELYLSQWLFAQLPAWSFQGYPVAGWKYRVCLVDGEGEPSVDGTFNMEWYGEQPSEENSQNSPFVQVTISSNGGTVEYNINFNLPQDTLYPPQNNVIANHRQLLANTVRNENEVNNDSDNSIYRNYKYLSWAFVVYRSVGAVYQEDLFSIKGKLPFYGERVTGNACILTNILVDLTTPNTNQTTEYFSTTRSTKVRVQFDYFSGNPSGTVPDDMWVYLIRNDSQNNQLDYYENYQYEQADLTNSVASTSITPVTIPTLISGDTFFTEFDISPLNVDKEGVESISDSFRLIFVVHSTVDSACRTDVTDPIGLINYNEEQMVLNGATVVFKTVEKEYLPSQNVLKDLCVGLNLETNLKVNLPLINSEVLAKSGGKITTAQESFVGAEVRIYEQNPLTGATLLNVEHFNAESQQICEGLTDTGAIVNRSQGSTIDLTLPFEIPDNVYRKMGREALFQSPLTVPTDWSELSLASLSCVVNNESGNCNVGLKLPDLLPIDNTIYGVYVPDTNEVWVTADDLSVPADGGIFAVELNNNLNMVQIATTVADKFYSIIYIPNVGVLVSRTTALQLDKYNPTTRTLISSVAVPGPINEMIYIASINEIWATQSTLNLIQRINPNTLALIGTIAIPGVAPTSLAYIPTLNEVWVNCLTSNDTHRVDVAINSVVGVPIVLSSTQPQSVIQAPNGNVWVGMVNAIDVIDPTTFAIIQTISIPGLTGLSIIDVGGLMYVQDGNNLILVYDPNLYTLLASYPVTPSGNRIVQAPSVLLSINSNSITPFLLDCNNSLPTNTFALKDIYIDWKLQFDFFDNTEFYVFQQKLAKPSLTRQADATDITDVVYNEHLENGATQVISTLCKSTNVVTVVTTFPTPKEVFSVAVEIQPIRGGVVSTTAPSSTVIIPVTSPYISKLNPAILTPTTSFSFDLDVPALPIDGDYEINLNYILK
jgi:hypothetical protein